jgi:Ca-activated chloride channel homolog
VTDHAALARIARDARNHGISITTLGYGLGYDEDLLGAIADGGGGSALHAEDPDTAGQLIAAEVTGLLTKSAQAVSLTIRPREPVTAVTVYGRLPSTSIDDGIVVELADFYAGETRKLLLRLTVPGIAALGLATIAELVFTYVETATLTTYTITVPIHVNVVPGDQAAGRIPDVAVRAERLFQEVQEAKRTSIDALATGDADQAAQLLDAARASLEEGAAWATDRAEEFAAEAEDLRRYSAMSHIDIGRTRKEAYQSWSHHTRTSGRPNYPDTPTKGENEA